MVATGLSVAGDSKLNLRNPCINAVIHAKLIRDPSSHPSIVQIFILAWHSSVLSPTGHYSHFEVATPCDAARMAPI